MGGRVAAAAVVAISLALVLPTTDILCHQEGTRGWLVGEGVRVRGSQVRPDFPCALVAQFEAT